MSIFELRDVPFHLLAATVERGRDRFPVRLKHIGQSTVVIGPVPLALHERARLTIACPLSEKACEMTTEMVRQEGESTWLSLTPRRAA